MSDSHVERHGSKLGRPELTVLLATLGACVPELAPPDPAEHRAEVLAWQSERVEELRQPDGWLSVVGLFWLEEGASSFGSDSNNLVVFPASAPPHIGTFIHDGDAVRMEVEPGVTVTHDDEPVTALALRSDAYRQPTVASTGSLRWFVLERQDRLGIRLKDTANPAIREFRGLESFPIDPAWNLPARFDRYDPPRTIEVPTVLGTISEHQIWHAEPRLPAGDRGPNLTINRTRPRRCDTPLGRLQKLTLARLTP